MSGEEYGQDVSVTNWPLESMYFVPAVLVPGETSAAENTPFSEEMLLLSFFCTEGWLRGFL